VSEIETDRLILRRLSIDDAQFILELLNEPSFLHFIGDRGVRTLDDARAYIVKQQVTCYERLGFGLYLTLRKEDGAAIGICGLVKRESLDDVDLGFAFTPRFWSQGYAAESASAVIAYATSVLGLPRVVAVTNPDNVASIKVLERIGLRFSHMARLTVGGPELKLFCSDASATPSASRPG
jgi:RimJ/RimL family protein N-acetyltransferase